MHPRGEFSRHYVVPGLVERGYAVFGHNGRYLNNDTDMVHERLLFDIAAGMRWLREQRFERVVLLGTAGWIAAGLLRVAGVAGSRREAHEDGGRREHRPQPGGHAGGRAVSQWPHLGEGRFMLNVLDPSVVDEEIR